MGIYEYLAAVRHQYKNDAGNKEWSGIHNDRYSWMRFLKNFVKHFYHKNVVLGNLPIFRI